MIKFDTLKEAAHFRVVESEEIIGLKTIGKLLLNCLQLMSTLQ